MDRFLSRRGPYFVVCNKYNHRITSITTKNCTGVTVPEKKPFFIFFLHFFLFFFGGGGKGGGIEVTIYNFLWYNILMGCLI